MTLNPWRLRLLADLATYRTVRAVAQRGNLSPSAISQQLATLERETARRCWNAPAAGCG